MKKEFSGKNVRDFLKNVDNISGMEYEYFTSNKLEVEYTPKNTVLKNVFRKELLKILDNNFSGKKIPKERRSGKKYVLEFELEEEFSNNIVSTQMQEKGAVWIFNQVLRNSNPNAKFSSIEDIKKYSKYDELKKIFGGEVPKDWLESYLKQQEKMIEIFQSPDWDEFKYSGSGSFMQYIKEVSSGLGYRYETWNPSDIWLVKKQSHVEKEINENIGKDGRTKGQTIYELNDLLRKLIKEKRVVGVSLKKVSGKKAKFEYVNIDSRIFDNKVLKRVKKEYNVPRSNIKIKLDLSLNNEKTKFNTQDLTVKVGNASNFQIKDNDGRFRNFGNLKFEYSPTSSSARGGKSPIEKVEELLKSNKLNFKNNHKNFITSWTDKEDLKNKLKPYRMKIDQIQKSVNIGSISTDRAIENFEVMFEQNKYLANSKLMQLEFIWQVLQITPSNNFEEFWTDMIWISLKKGKDFAPHGKLY
jgi:hypothetical protein